MPWGRALATVVFDRAGDVVALAILLGVSVWGIDEAPWLRRIAVGTLVAVAVIVLVVAFARLYAGRRRRERRHRGACGRSSATWSTASHARSGRV